jgi:NhaP-type Na+/H+ or K+/H+ antiporter
MLGVGVILGPELLGMIHPELLAVGADLRLIALIVILLRVGLEINRKTLHRVGGRVLLLAFLPATCEAAMIAVIAPVFLPLTHLEGLLLGTVLAAVSPAVVMPLMSRFMLARKGARHDVPAMVMAAASLDDIYVIVAHAAVTGVYVGQQVNLVWQVVSVPVSLLLGAGAGCAIGGVLYALFGRFKPRATKRVVVLVALAIVLVRIEHLLAGWVPFAGLVAAMGMGFVLLEKDEAGAHRVSAKLAKIWVAAEIILFSMVGAQVELAVAWQAGLSGLAILAIGLMARGVGVHCCLLGSKLNWKERLFVMVSFFPKATVQAAIGGAPLMAMAAAGMPTDAGKMILAIAVLSIVVTAPVGAWVIAWVGERFLEADVEQCADAQAGRATELSG